MKSALIFDMDGTLWNASAASAIGWNHGMKKLGMERKVTAEDIESIAGLPYEQCIETLLPGEMKKNTKLESTLDEQETNAVKEYGGIFYPGVIEGIEKLSETHDMYLVSNCQAWYMDLFFQFSNLKPYFKGYDCYGMSQSPKTEMIKNMGEEHNLEKPVYIGDTQWDKEAAQGAGVEFHHVTYGFQTSVSATKKFNSFPELADYFINEE